MANPETIESHAFRVGGSYYAKARPKEVRVTFSNSPEKLAARNSITDRGVIVFKKAAKHDDFERKVAERLFPALNGSKSLMQKAVAGMINESDVIDFDESQVQDCTVIADFDGKRRTIYLLESGSSASRLPLSVDLDLRGHPDRTQCRTEMIDLLREKIIAKVENG